MSNTFFISDTHFGHKNILNFEHEGKPLRTFDSAEEMDEHMVDCWNKTVKPHDTIYHVGDFCMNRKSVQIAGRLNGRKILIKGNHDIFKLKDYTPYFEDIRAYKVMPKHGIICSHIPIHPDSLYRWKLNIHGHLHAGNVTDTWCEPDKRYFNVSVEQLNYTPISFDEIIKNTSV